MKRVKSVFIIIIVLVLVTSIIYYISNANSLISTIEDLANDNNITITKIKVTVFNGFDRYNYSNVDLEKLYQLASKYGEVINK